MALVPRRILEFGWVVIHGLLRLFWQTLRKRHERRFIKIDVLKGHTMTDRKDTMTDHLMMDDAVVSAQELAEMGGRKLVYIRPVIAGDVAEFLVDDDGYQNYDLPDDATLYSVHAADGERIALVGDLDLAFAAARQQEMNPVNVH